MLRSLPNPPFKSVCYYVRFEGFEQSGFKLGGSRVEGGKNIFNSLGGYEYLFKEYNSVLFSFLDSPFFGGARAPWPPM